MNKKGIIAIVIIVVLVVIGFLVWGRSNKTSVDNQTRGTKPTELPTGVNKDDYAPTTKDTTDTSLLGRLKNAFVSASETGTRVALQNGSAKFTDGEVKGTVTLGDIAVEKTIGSTNYALASLSVNSGGSGTYKYVVLFEDKNGTLTDKSYSVIGDRVSITGIRADMVTDAAGKAQLVVTVSYLDHDRGEPLSANPTVPHTKILVVENGEFNPAKEINL